MISAIDSALSGLSAASKRLEVSAVNIANQATPINKLQQSKPALPQDVVQLSEESGGVKTQTRDSAEPEVKRFDPQNEQADADGFVSYPGTDTAKELVNQNIAAYDFKANLQVIKTASKIEQSLLDIFS